MNSKHLTLAAVGLLAVVVVWQEVRIRALSAEVRAKAESPDRGLRGGRAPELARERRGPEPREAAGFAPDRAADRPSVDRAVDAVAALGEARQRAAFSPDGVQLGGEPGDEAPLDTAGAAPEQLAELVAAEIEKRDEERWERRRARVLEDAQTSVAEFIEEQGLEEQVGIKLSSMITAEREQMMEYFRQGRAGEVPFHEVREKIGALRDETDKNVEAILDDDAFAAYQTRREEERGPWRRGRPGR